jgi:hypothetical protein
MGGGAGGEQGKDQRRLPDRMVKVNTVRNEKIDALRLDRRYRVSIE